VSKSDDDAVKKAILARRARFIAAAVASVGIACGKTTKEDAPPVPCLSVPLDYDAQPMPCLKQAVNRDAAVVGSADAGAPAPDAAPVPCLSVAMPMDAGAKDAGAKPKEKP
jgi:hypothetical protein